MLIHVKRQFDAFVELTILPANRCESHGSHFRVEQSACKQGEDGCTKALSSDTGWKDLAAVDVAAGILGAAIERDEEE